MTLEPIKDEEKSHPIAHAWRTIFVEVVAALVQDDFELKNGVKNVAPVEKDIAEINRSNVKEYEERLIPLTEQTWSSSCAQWIGPHWEVLIDLCTESEGVSDLVLHGEVKEQDGVPMITIGLIYVP